MISNNYVNSSPSALASPDLTIKMKGRQEYATCWMAMKAFTRERNSETLDEIWLLEHLPVFTQGQNGRAEHVLNPGKIPVIQTDRGGQVTYHGPGQLMVYTLIDIKRKRWSIRDLVSGLEQSVIEFLQTYQLKAYAKRDAPGIYLQSDMKICSVGLRIRQGCAYHGMAFNISMDLTPFRRINPCGFSQLTMTQLADHVSNFDLSIKTISHDFSAYLLKNLQYNSPIFN